MQLQTLPTDRPDTGAESTEHDGPQREGAQEHPQASQEGAGDAGTGAPRVVYSKLASRLLKAASKDDADLIVDEGRALPADQQDDLRRLAGERWPAQ